MKNSSSCSLYFPALPLGLPGADGHVGGDQQQTQKKGGPEGLVQDQGAQQRGEHRLQGIKERTGTGRKDSQALGPGVLGDARADDAQIQDHQNTLPREMRRGGHGRGGDFGGKHGGKGGFGGRDRDRHSDKERGFGGRDRNHGRPNVHTPTERAPRTGSAGLYKQKKSAKAERF